MKVKISAKIQSHSHKITPEVFEIFKGVDSSFFISEVSERAFTVSTESPREYTTEADFAPAAHKILTLFLISLNASTLGFFTFDWFKMSDISYDFSSPMRSGKLIAGSEHSSVADDILTAQQVNRALMLFGALGRERDHSIPVEYSKGIIHLALRYGEVDFIREAFGNFYRAFEYLITTRVLKVSKLNNELRNLKDGFRKIVPSDSLLKELTSLYKIRCSQIMHSQRKPASINIEEVFKIKAYVDLTLDRIYKPIYVNFVEEQKYQKK